MGDGARVYVGTYDGLQVLTVHGKDCQAASAAFSGEIVQALGGCRRSLQRVFAGLRHGLFRTDDAGVSWHKVLDGDVRSVTIDPTDDRVVYAGTDPVHLFRSEDGGDSWEELVSLQELPEATHRKLGETDEVDMTTSHQQTFRHRRQDWWFPVPPHQGHVLPIFVHPNDPNLLLLPIEHGGAALSTDRGRTWEDVSEGIDYLDIHVILGLPQRFDRYFLTSARGLYTTDDPAHGWTRAQNGIDRDYFHDLLMLPPENGGDPVLIVASAEGSPGFWPAIKGREQWDHSQQGSRSALFRSADCGQSWKRVGAGQGLPEEMEAMIWALCPDPRAKHGLLAGIGESPGVPSPNRRGGGGAVLASSDAGDTWQTLIKGLSAIEHIYATSA